MIKCSTPLAIREMQIKTTPIFHPKKKKVLVRMQTENNSFSLLVTV
jgi:hypothetical protein